MLKKDNYLTGIIVGSVTPILFYALLYGFDLLFFNTFAKHLVRAPHFLMLLAITPNLFWLRYYMGKLKFTKTGMALFLLTMVFILLYFFKYFQNPQ